LGSISNWKMECGSWKNGWLRKTGLINHGGNM
jgi:hypothetical protein